MFCLSEIVASTCYCSSIFPGMTISTMEQNTFGLCWSLLGHVFTPDWHAFKMVGYPHHTAHYRCQDHWEVTNHVIRRKGLMIMEHPWISIVHWHSSRYYGTLPSIKQWPHRTGCATFKCGFKATQGGSIQEKTLKMYCITPHTTAGLSPAQVLRGRHLRSWLVRQFPDMQEHIQSKQPKQAAYHDNSKPLRSFSVGDQVYTPRTLYNPSTWILGVIIRATGPLT